MAEEESTGCVETGKQEGPKHLCRKTYEFKSRHPDMKKTEVIYGPYTRPDGRMHMCILDLKTGKRTTISYPKYLLQKQGFDIPKGYHVHHIDGNFKNNNLDNLEIKEAKKHISEHNKGIGLMITFMCPVCKTNFTIPYARYRHNQLVQGKAGPYCSKSCSGKIHH